MKTIYGIKQKYNLKDYVQYYQSRDGNGNLCNKQYGYITRVEYSVNIKGEIVLTYVIAEFIGCSSGYCVPQKAIIKRATPKVPNYGYREYLQHCIKVSENIISTQQKEKERYLKTLEELDDGKTN